MITKKKNVQKMSPRVSKSDSSLNLDAFSHRSPDNQLRPRARLPALSTDVAPTLCLGLHVPPALFRKYLGTRSLQNASASTMTLCREDKPSHKNADGVLEPSVVSDAIFLSIFQHHVLLMLFACPILTRMQKSSNQILTPSSRMTAWFRECTNTYR